MNRSTKVILAVAMSVIILSVGFIGGFAVSKISPALGSLTALPSPDAASSGVGAAVDDINKLLKARALEPPSETSATAGAIQGLLDSGGDKYAVYFNKTHYKAFNEETMGAFGGIGVTLGQNKEGQAYVVEVFPDTPAQKAGIKAGDVFTSIDGVTRAKWTTEEVVKRVRGEEGTKVKVVMSRPTKDPHVEPTQLPFDITRAKIIYPNIKAEKIGDVGYIRLGQFNAKAVDDVKKAVQDLTKQGVKGFVLDLRDDPGGLLDQAVDVSSLFIADGAIVRVDERGKPEQVLSANGNKITDAPMAVLINGDSASASEITAGALQDYARAVLVGETSFGKGSVQTIEQLPDGGAVKFTIAHYLTPKKRVINGIGLTPDVIVVMDREKQADKKTDTQLQKALDVVKQKIKGGN
ncbi:MAG: S41 family peptidase [Coriobacteriia bacterium]